MDKLQVCNLAIACIGSGRTLTALDNNTPEAEACALFYDTALQMCLDRYNWSFARRDEIITTKDIHGGEGVAVPYLYAYRIPNDVSRILYLKHMGSSSMDETGGATTGIPFNFRNIDNVKYIACDERAPFEIHYQCLLEDLSICSPTFIHALALQLATLCTPLIVGGSEAFKIVEALNKQYENAIARASAVDAQQGSYALKINKRISLIDSRR